VSSSHNKGARCFIEQDTLPLLLGTKLKNKSNQLI